MLGKVVGREAIVVGTPVHVYLSWLEVTGLEGGLEIESPRNWLGLGAVVWVSGSRAPSSLQVLPPGFLPSSVTGQAIP